MVEQQRSSVGRPLFRSFSSVGNSQPDGRQPSGEQVVVQTGSVCRSAARQPPNAPWSERMAITAHTLPATVIDNVSAVITTNGQIKNRRRPIRSIKRPTTGRVSSAAAKKIVVAVPTAVGLAPSSSRTRRGTAASMIPIAKKLLATATSSNRRVRGGAASSATPLTRSPAPLTRASRRMPPTGAGCGIRTRRRYGCRTR